MPQSAPLSLAISKERVVIGAMTRKTIGGILIESARTWAACNASKRAKWKIAVIASDKTCSAIFKL